MKPHSRTTSLPIELAPVLQVVGLVWPEVNLSICPPQHLWPLSLPHHLLSSLLSNSAAALILATVQSSRNGLYTSSLACKHTVDKHVRCPMKLLF